MRRLKRTLVPLLAGVVVLGCGGEDEAPATASASAAAATTAPQVDRFDGDRAMRLVRRQLAKGQRTAGSPQLRALAEELRPLLPGGRFEPVPGEPGLRNVVGSLPGKGKAIVLGAHYDVLAKPEGFLGANNGAAGTAIVIEAARALKKVKRGKDAPPIRFVLFDGEEPAQGLPEEQPDFYSVGLRGSRADAKKNAAKTRAMVLLDYVANKGLQLPREATSDTALWARLRAASRRVGAQRFFPGGTGPSITDDHTPFLRAGVPAIDLIDWSYACGHEACDTYEQLDPKAADAVGETVVELLRTLR